MDEPGWLEWAFKGMVTLVGLVLTGWSGWLMSALAKNAKDIESMKDMIHRHELEDARTYVTEQRFKETVVEIKDTAKRTYDKIDEIYKMVSKT